LHLRDATLLVVDDEPYYCEIAKDWFEREGCRVLTADDGVAALALLEKEKADIIITDIRMPRMDGVELIRRLKARGSYMPTAVALSGFSDLSPREAYDLGIEAQLSKPVSRRVLISAVETALTDRSQLWTGSPLAGKRFAIHAQFDSLQAARDNREIAFGRGGFCMRSDLVVSDDSAVEFHLVFGDQVQPLHGQGTLRWASPAEHAIGVEIARVQEGLDWISELARENKSVSFIPGGLEAASESIRDSA
jgi:CheY-like chemotaxis protein